MDKLARGLKGLAGRVSILGALSKNARTLVVEASGRPTVTVKAARKELITLVGSAKSFGAGRDPAVLNMALAESQDELPKRQMADSYCEAYIPLGTDPRLREKYINFHNTVRFGRVLEDLDTMADITGDIMPDRDVFIRGHVTYVGQSSLEVTMKVEQDNENGSIELMEAKFLMVARDPQNISKAYVNPLVVDDPREMELFKEGEANKINRKKQASESLLKTPPNEEERFQIHDLFLQTLDPKAATFRHPVKPESSVWMEDAMLKNIIICFPEKRNLYNKIFGGFLMRQAFEIAWANACVYSKMRPFALAIDDILFKKPVPVGSLLYLSSQVVYTSGPHLQVRVHAEVVDPATGEHETTNIFHLTFKTIDPVPLVMPKSYSEYMIYIDGKRHFEESMRKQVV